MMKFVMDEKLKHRLIGLAVLISLGALFAPAIMKKSSQNLDENLTMNVRLPNKPEAPKVTLTDEKELFKTIKIARVKIPPVPTENKSGVLAKAQMIKPVLTTKSNIIETPSLATNINKTIIQLAVNDSAKNTVKNKVLLAENKIATTKPVMQKANKIAVKNTVSKADVYAVQLASFSQLNNAQTLIKKLRSKGYKATLATVRGKSGTIYKVYAAHSARKVDVLKAKTQLASVLQLNGFIVNTGVS
jgi:DedD protein